MLDRHIRRAGVRLIEEALTKAAVATIQAPTLAVLKAQKTRELNGTQTATAAVPKVLTPPT
jgi:hypothetical protein